MPIMCQAFLQELLNALTHYIASNYVPWLSHFSNKEDGHKTVI